MSAGRRPPAKAPGLDGLEEKWQERWEATGTYRFDRTKPRSAVYSIDTPPPTVSGELHIGHVLSYTHTDLVARFQRMRGKEVFYPMGWDDNGLPTERRVQQLFGVRPDLSLPYDPGFTPPPTPPDPPVAISPRNFVELCARQAAQDERAYEGLWRRLGLSVDWSLGYTTIGERARRTSQRAFLGLLRRGLAYRAEAPVLWDVDFRTAVAQAELEDRTMAAAAFRLRFGRAGGGHVLVETTRPELLPACVAVVVHPSDDRHRALVGSELVTPLLWARVPVLAHELADPDRGTGVAMVCTFGDLTDVTWWRELRLPVRAIVRPDGTIGDVPWGGSGWESESPEQARAAQGELAGLTVEEARARIADLLARAGALEGEPGPIRHEVKFYEKGDRPVEILTTRQWFVRTLPLREQLLELGRELRWHPPHMRARFESWVRGLHSDWCISRQRSWGVRFPVWYPLRGDGSVDHDHPIAAADDGLPVDPSVDVPPGFRPEQRGAPDGFAADPDVMDTWATSSLTPQIAGGWVDDPDLFPRVFPMDLRPQAHDIIRTWLFTTLLRAHLEHGGVPWSDVAISGWVLDPERRKMSKSKGNVLTPAELIGRHGADAVRYWASQARLGIDTTFDEGQVRVGRRLAVKLLNASRFVLLLQDEAKGGGPEAAEALDRSMLASLADVAREASAALGSYEHARALDVVERSFWRFCDDYLELVKNRAYGSRGPAARASAVAALRRALSAYQRLLAPFLPYATEEAWSWWQEGSVHRAPWPEETELREGAGDPGLLELASTVLGQIRAARSRSKLPLGASLPRAVVQAPLPDLAALAPAWDDLREAARVGELDASPGDGLEVSLDVPN